MADGRSRAWLWALIAAGAFFLFFLAIFSLVYFSVRSGEENTEYGGHGDKIAVVDLEGVIIDAEQTVKRLKRFADDDSIKAIILHVNTPGGGAAASEEITREAFEPFHFCASIEVTAPLQRRAWTLQEFRDCLDHVARQVVDLQKREPCP